MTYKRRKRFEVDAGSSGHVVEFAHLEQLSLHIHIKHEPGFQADYGLLRIVLCGLGLSDPALIVWAVSGRLTARGLLVL